MTTATPPRIAILLASGTGERARLDIPKQFLKVAGKTVFEHTLDVFEAHEQIDDIILVVNTDSRLVAEELVVRGRYAKVREIVLGGATRRESSAAGIAAVRDDDAKVLVHDIVRPLLDSATIQRCLDALDTYDAVDTAIPSADTIIERTPEGTIAHIPDRSTLRLGQTPQAFRAGLLREAHRRAAGDASVKVTDDCGLVVNYGLASVAIVDGDVNNIKITYPSDIYLADRLFQLRSRARAETPHDTSLSGKTVVVFGGHRGIGEAVVELARSRGAAVHAFSTRDGVNIARPADVRRALQLAAGDTGAIDMVVNAAGVLRQGLLEGSSYEKIEEQVSANLVGAIVVAKESFPYLADRRGSLILFTSSSYTRGRARTSVYSATKAAVVNLAQGLAQEFAGAGVRINVVNPERTATPMRSENFGVEPTAQLLDAVVVAEATLALATSDVTGEVLDVRKEPA
ncbi:2-C-methyl-D-erythritol 4-phosphate cytidylyltransferase [Luteibacter sp. SG786]|uniref:2-C-methyl-D-erythritol 4-phosphate cytidylyltransferase n=1 Tax=Luteibacter sp. SG786 TaxID=2587130 RepID=UPI0014205EC9|nr:2-C-methyl-D-erythritol 4-phosphate cytidylyltransferase [Luteibacter sp. SG786]NII53150.1 2-C-methyl-D-erythritol 4-phosphate cytidylyltransferase [Luteibacter sp. SG786]